MGSKRRNQNSVLKRIGRRILGMFLIIGIPTAAFVLTFHLKNVTVVGTTRYTSQEITDMIIKEIPDKNALLLYLKYRYFTSPKIPFIEKVDIEMVDTHSVIVNVYEKRVTGCVEYLGEYLYFDKDGIVVESSSKHFMDIPQIKGLTFNKIILNEKLEVQKKELFDTILNLTQQIEKFELDVSTITFHSNYEVTLDCNKHKIMLGKRTTYNEVLAELKNILDKTEGMELTIDMRDYEEDTKAIFAKPLKSTD